MERRRREGLQHHRLFARLILQELAGLSGQAPARLDRSGSARVRDLARGQLGQESLEHWN